MNTNEKKNNSKLMIFTASLSFGVTWMMTIISAIQDVLPFSFNKTWVQISSLQSDKYNPQWMNFVTLKFAFVIVFIIISLILMVHFFKQSKRFPVILVIYFMIRILLMVIVFYFQTIVIGPATPTLPEITLETIRSLGVTALWIPYILLSKKAREIFIY